MAIIHQKPALTVFTDCSLSTEQKLLGWAGWAIADGKEPVWASGSSKASSQNTTYYELLAMRNMLTLLKQDAYAVFDVPMVLQMDNLGSLGILLSAISNAYAAKATHARDARIVPVTNMQDIYNNAIEDIRELLSKSPVVYLKHIKGHQGNRHSRSSIHSKVDVMANNARMLHHKKQSKQRRKNALADKRLLPMG